MMRNRYTLKKAVLFSPIRIRPAIAKSTKTPVA
jgi:hypothetical protein